jgi:membrane-associated protease RseP (regulator of RpoE activity)
MSEVVAPYPYAPDSSIQISRPNFSSFLQPDTNAGGTNVYQNNDREEYRRLHVPTATGPPDFKMTCCTEIDGENRYLLGIVNEVGVKRYGFLSSISNSATVTKSFLTESVKSLLSLPSKIPALWGQTVRGEERDANGLVGVVGVARVSGEAVGSDQLTVQERLATFILIIASLNIFIGIFNLLPILPLDGGHMAVAIADEIRALVARLRGRPRPAAIDVTVLTPVTMVVFVILATLTLLLLVADVINPVVLNL